MALLVTFGVVTMFFLFPPSSCRRHRTDLDRRKRVIGCLMNLENQISKLSSRSAAERVSSVKSIWTHSVFFVFFFASAAAELLTMLRCLPPNDSDDVSALLTSASHRVCVNDELRKLNCACFTLFSVFFFSTSHNVDLSINASHHQFWLSKSKADYSLLVGEKWKEILKNYKKLIRH